MRYTNFCRGRVESDFGSEADLGALDGIGAKGAKAEFMAAKFLNGLERSMNTIPILNTWTPPPDM